MVWEGFVGTKKTKLLILEGKQNAQEFIQILEEYLLPFSEDMPLTWIFIQDGALCHRANIVKDWCEDNYILLLKWPAYFPDLNPIENLCMKHVIRYLKGTADYGLLYKKSPEHGIQAWSDTD